MKNYGGHGPFTSRNNGESFHSYVWHLPSPNVAMVPRSACLTAGTNPASRWERIWGCFFRFFPWGLELCRLGCSLWSNVSKAIINRQDVGLCWWLVAPIHWYSLYIWGGLLLLYIQIPTAMGCRLGCWWLRSSTHQRGTNICTQTSWYTPVLLICFYGGLAFTGDILTIVETPYLLIQTW